MLAVHFLVSFLSFFVSSYGYCIDSNFKVSVETKQGIIYGFQEYIKFSGDTYPVQKFLGIPYAEPPMGDLRFAKPVKKAKFETPFNATDFGSICPQDAQIVKLWTPGNSTISEDCLSLNIFRPASPYSTLLPVMVWFYGGAYLIGQSDAYSAENLATFTDVVVVTVNYRIGPFGFLATDDDTAKGNYGLWDQNLALNWVQENIEFFGGDKTKVTLFGQSAGAASSLYHSLNPMNDNLFHRVIAQSGSPSSPWAFGQKDKIGKYTKILGERVGCKSNDNPSLLECLRRKPFKDILKHSQVGTSEESLFRSDWVPVFDNEYIKMNPIEIFREPSNMSPEIKKMFADVDVLLGTNEGDGSLVAELTVIPYVFKTLRPDGNGSLDVGSFLANKILKDGYDIDSETLANMVSYVYTDWKQDQVYISNLTLYIKIRDMVGDYGFNIPSTLLALAHSKLQRKSRHTYMYHFSHHTSFLINKRTVPEAGHSNEIPYIFGFPNSLRRPFGYHNESDATEFEISLSKQMMKYWTNFAKTGNPNSDDLPFWPTYCPLVEKYMELNEPGPTYQRRRNPARAALWFNLLPRSIHQLQKF